MNSEAKLSCKRLWKLYGSEPDRFFARHNNQPEQVDITDGGYICAVREVTFDVYPGEIVVVMGLSGSGKSTLVRCLSRLIEPTGGEITFEGQNLLAASRKEMIEIRRHKMGMVFQHFALLPHRTVIDNIAFPLEVQGVSRAKRHERAREIIDLVGLSGRERYYPRELSGGQQQRVGIARSLAVEPDIWFLDEPFSALDPLIRREMQDEFLRLQSLLKKTIVFITHDFDEAIRLADRIAIMNEGEVVQFGSVEDLVLNPATDYVRDFTKEIPKEKFLTVGSVMGPISENIGTLSFRTRDLIADIAAEIIQSEFSACVIDDAGQNVGSLTRDQVVKIVFPNEK
mgnify:FL=1|jgi:glycine betaine/proline transport system ATP-binding protein